MLLKKLRWTLKRHPFLYLSRFRLLSKNSNEDEVSTISYNDWNKKEDIPAFFYEINEQIFENGKPDSDLELVLELSSWLYNNTNTGSGLSKPSAKTLETMLYGKGGVCSDMVQIFNNFCVINDIKVREWGTTSAPFNRENGGHSFNEVYIEELKKWIFIDPSWCMMFYDESKRPLSVIEVYKLLRSGSVIKYKSYLSGKEIEINQVNKNYLNPDVTPFLICAYRNKLYDRYLKLARPYIPVFIIHFFLYLSGRSYFYKFPLDDYNRIFS
jgi:hypothetical protein